MRPESTERSEKIAEKIHILTRSKTESFTEFKRELIGVLSLLNQRMDSLENFIEPLSKIQEL